MVDEGFSGSGLQILYNPYDDLVRRVTVLLDPIQPAIFESENILETPETITHA
jgi:hypothetical protein